MFSSAPYRAEEAEVRPLFLCEALEQADAGVSIAFFALLRELNAWSAKHGSSSVCFFFWFIFLAG